VARFVVGAPVVTSEPVVAVDAPLAAGQHAFTLVVEDDAGNRSAPARALVTVFSGKPLPGPQPDPGPKPPDPEQFGRQ
jgi:hypothetical protein